MTSCDPDQVSHDNVFCLYRCFSKSSVEEILQALKNDDSEWSQQQLEVGGGGWGGGGRGGVEECTCI